MGPYYAYASTSDTGCISTVRVPVVATINYVPIVNTTKNASRCGTGSVTLSATAEIGTIRWFDGSSNQVGTGKYFYYSIFKCYYNLLCSVLVFE